MVAEREGRCAVYAAVLALLALLSSAACSNHASPSASNRNSAAPTVSPPRVRVMESGLAPFLTQRLEWRPCGERLACTDVAVPLSYEDPVGERAHLRVSRVAALREPSGVLFVNPGGPGVSGADYAESVVAHLPRRLLERFDIVGIDHRGTGAGSSRLNCPEDGALDKYLSAASPRSHAAVAHLAALAASLAQTCRTNDGSRLQDLAVEVVARDTDVVRAALGAEHVSYLGKSYGTLQALVYAARYPSRVDRLVLDGVVDPTLPAHQAALAQASALNDGLAGFVDYCLRRRCSGENTSEELHMRLRSWWTGLPQHSAPVPGLSRLDAAAALAAGLTDPEAGWPLLSIALPQAFNGDHDSLVELAHIMRGRNGRNWPERYVASLLIPCLDRSHPATTSGFLQLADLLRARSWLFGDFIAQQELACVSLPSRSTVSMDLTSVGRPVLVVATRHDPATPYEEALRVTERLPAARQITFTGYGHTAFASRNNRCVDEHVVLFLLEARDDDYEDSICS